MHIITIATEQNNWLEDWEMSINQWGYNYSILGMGVPWDGFCTKIKLILDFLHTRELSEIICIVDAYDLVFAGPQDELNKKFKSFNSPIVVGGEDICFLNCHKHTCDVNNEKYRWVNGGCIIGFVKNLIDAYTFVLDVSPQDDQVGIAKYMDKYPSEVTIDGNQKLIANIRRINEIKKIDGKRFQHVETGTIPVIVHTPFMYSDLGARSEFVRKHALNEYESPEFLTYTTGLFKHLYKHLTKNPVYNNIKYIVYVVIVFIIVYIFYLLHRRYKNSNNG